MSLKALPILFLNMGGEMLYILDQRLKAQNITKDKSAKVLHDIIQTFLNKKFVDELLKPQPMYPRKALRSMYERLAHSSIMRLNADSMEKLYDLMVMAVKYQICLCKRPQDILLITLNHLDVIQFYAEGSTNCVEQVNYTYQLLHKTYASLNPGVFMLIRQTLLDFLQDIHVRVSIFLRDKVQYSVSGQFNLPIGGQVPYGVDVPGKIRLFDMNGECVKTVEFSAGASYTRCAKDGSYERHGDRVTQLGTNMYSAVRVSETTVSRVDSPPETVTSSDYDPGAGDWRALAQLDLLSQLIGGGRGQSSDKSKMEFHLDFLNSTDDVDEEDYDRRSVMSSRTVSSGATAYNVVNIDASKKKHSDELSRIMGDMHLETSNERDDKDLLDLMDSIN